MMTEFHKIDYAIPADGTLVEIESQIENAKLKAVKYAEEHSMIIDHVANTYDSNVGSVVLEFFMKEKPTHGADIPEVPPILNTLPAVWDLVIEDMRKRDAMGMKKYGTRLQPRNGRDPLQDAYQEALDLVVYLRQAIYERDNEENDV
jgi:hypothetical protein